MKSSSEERFQELLEKLCCDELRGAEHGELECLLSGNPEHHHEYVRYLHMHVCLKQALGADQSALLEKPRPSRSRAVVGLSLAASIAIL